MKEKKSLLRIVKQREDYVKQNNEEIGICERKFYKMITLHFSDLEIGNSYCKQL